MEIVTFSFGEGHNFYNVRGAIEAEKLSLCTLPYVQFTVLLLDRIETFSFLFSQRQKPKRSSLVSSLLIH